MPVRRACTSRVESQTGSRRGGAGESGSGSGRGKIEQLGAVLGTEPAQPQPLEWLLDASNRNSGKAGDLVPVAGPNPAR